MVLVFLVSVGKEAPLNNGNSGLCRWGGSCLLKLLRISEKLAQRRKTRVDVQLRVFVPIIKNSLVVVKLVESELRSLELKIVPNWNHQIARLDQRRLLAILVEQCGRALGDIVGGDWNWILAPRRAFVRVRG